jgi:hypothetical protein
MSKKLAKKLGFEIGEKVLYPHYTPYVVQMEIVTVKDVRPLYNFFYNEINGGKEVEVDDGEIVMDVEEFEGYINPLSVYTKKQILVMFDKN